MQDYVRQLGENRMASAKLQSSVSSSLAGAQLMKAQLSLERVSKQKSILKYVREQMRLSDTKLVLGDMASRTQTNLAELEKRRAGLSNYIGEDRLVKVGRPTNRLND